MGTIMETIKENRRFLSVRFIFWDLLIIILHTVCQDPFYIKELFSGKIFIFRPLPIQV